MRDSCFRELDISQVKESFQNAIEKGMKDAEDWMYMYSDGGYDYFKHGIRRSYTRYAYVGIIQRICMKFTKREV